MPFELNTNTIKAHGYTIEYMANAIKITSDTDEDFEITLFSDGKFAVTGRNA